MTNSFNKLIFLFSLSVGSFLIYRNNQDINNFHIYLVFFMFFSTVSIVFIPIFKPKLIGKIPLIYLVNLYFLICYLGVFLFDKNIIFYDQYENEDHEKAINTLFIGYIFFLLGYYFIKKILKNYNRKSFVYLNPSTNEVFLLGTSILISVIILFYIINIQMYFSSLGQIKFPLLLFSIGLCFNLILKKVIKGLKLYFIYIIIILPIFFELLSGSFNFPFMIIFLIYVHYIVYIKKVNLIPFLIISFLFLFIHIGKYDYRLQTWVNKDLNLNLFDKSKIFFNNYFKSGDVLIINGNIKTKDLKIKDYIQKRDNYRLERRIFHSYWSLLIVTKNSPEKIPYWNGQSYKLLMSKIIPRIFWKNKPSDTLGNDFGHRYNVLTKDSKLTKKDNGTSWNMPVLNEFYVNFGKIGVIFGMFIIGAVMKLLTKIASLKNNNNLELIIGFYLFTPLFFFESHLSLLFGAIIQSYIFLLIVSICFLFLLRKIIVLK